MNFKWLVFCFVIALSVISIEVEGSWTASGCVSDDTGYLYPDYSGVYRSGGYGPAYETSTVITSFGSGNYCSPAVMGNCVIRTRSDCRDCNGPYDYDSSKNRTDYWYEQRGKLTYYMACPIDDYIGLVLLAVAGVGFVVLRKSALLA